MLPSLSILADLLIVRLGPSTKACFSILVSGPHLDAIITSQNIFRRSSIGVIIFNCGPLLWLLPLF